jgi:glutaminyl-tRNA synthetase
LFIERDDFMETPPAKYYRLFPGNEVRLRYAYLVTCTSSTRDPVSGEIIELHCQYDPDTRGGDAPDGRKVKSTIHWVSAQHAAQAEVRLYDQLFLAENPDISEDLESAINPRSLEIIENAQVEESLSSVNSGDKYQFERTGYFCVDQESNSTRLVFNRTVSLRDTWSKVNKPGPIS